MPRELRKAAVLRAWRQRRSALPNDIRAVLSAADLAAERTAACLRSGILILIGLALVGFGSLAGVYSKMSGRGSAIEAPKEASSPSSA